MKKDKEKSLIDSIISTSLGYTDNFPKRALWKEIVEIYNGEFKVFYNSGQELERHKVTIPYKKWEIIISVSDTRPLKFSTVFSYNQEFEFFLSWEGIIEKIAKKFGKKEFEFGWKDFDNHYLIEGSNEEYVKQVITQKVQKIILKNNIYSISYQTDLNSRSSELLGVIQRQAGEKELIIEIIEMYKLMIDNLNKKNIIK